MLMADRRNVTKLVQPVSKQFSHGSLANSPETKPQRSLSQGSAAKPLPAAHVPSSSPPPHSSDISGQHEPPMHPSTRQVTSPSPRTTRNVQKVVGGLAVERIGFAPLSGNTEGFESPASKSSTSRSAYNNLGNNSANSPPARMLEPIHGQFVPSSSPLNSARSSMSFQAASIRYPGSASPAPVQKKEYSLDDFEMIKKLGQGAFGKVVMVRKKDSGNIYAMKCVSKSRAMQSGTIQEALLEMKVLQSIHQHPFVVSMRYAFQTDDALFIVLDFAGGGDSLQLLKEKKYLPEDWVKFYAAEVLLAIEFMHDQDIIYRDLKPENVLLTTEGHILLADFGLSKPECTGMSLTHTFCGTPHYASPEMIQRTGHTKTVDWWALGVAIYEWCVGKPPWRGDDVSKIFQQILSGKPKFPVEMSKAACDIVERLLERDPTKRLGYNGAAEIKAHPFFADLDFDLILRKEVTVPYLPSNITQGLPEKKRPGKKIIAIQKHIPGFHFVNPDSPTFTARNIDLYSNPSSTLVHSRQNSYEMPIMENFVLGSQNDIRHQRLQQKDLSFLKMIEDLTLFTEVRVDGIIVYDSPPMCQLLGISDSVARVNQNIMDYIHEEDQEVFRTSMNDVRRSGPSASRNVCTVRMRNRHDPNNPSRWVHIDLKLQCATSTDSQWDGNDENSQVFMLGTDVTKMAEAKEVVRSEIEDIYGQRNLDLIPALVGDRVVLPRVADSEVESGHQEYRRRLKQLAVAFPHYTMELVSITCSDEQVLAKWKFSGAHMGLYRGMQATGKSTICFGMNIYKIADQKIVDIMLHFDSQIMVATSGGETSDDEAMAAMDTPPPQRQTIVSIDNSLLSQAKWFLSCALVEKNIDKIASMCHKNVELSDTVFPGQWRGFYDLRVVLEKYWKAFPDLQIQIDETILKEMKAVVRWRGTGTHSSTFCDVKTTKKVVQLSGICIFSFEGPNQLLTTFSMNLDILAFLKQLGINFSHGALATNPRLRKISESGEPFSPSSEKTLEDGRSSSSTQSRVDMAKSLLVESAGFIDQTQRLSLIMCDWFGFKGSVVWVPTSDGAFEALTFYIGDKASTGLRAFIEKCSDFVIDANTTLAGQTKTSGMPIWLNEIVLLTHQQYPMVKCARKYELKSGVMFPLTGRNGDVVAVVEMYKESLSDKDLDVVDFCVKLDKAHFFKS